METIKNSKKAYIIETIMFFTYVFFGVNWIVGTTLTPEIMEYFKLSTFSSATFVSNAITIAKILGNLVAADILYKLFPKKAIGLASFSIFFGSMIAIIAPSYIFFIFGRFIMGFGGALYIVYFNPVVINYFTEDKRPFLNTVNNACYNIGSIVALICVGPVVNLLKNWKYSMAFFAMISLVLFIIWIIFGEDFEILKKNEKKSKLSIELKEKFTWILPFTYAGRLTLFLVFLTIFPISGLSVIDAKLLSVLIAIGGLFGSFFAMKIAKKSSRRLPVIRYSGLGMPICAVILLLTQSSIIEIIASFLVGVFIYLPLTSLFTIPQELEGMTISRLTAVMSLFWSISYIFETISYYLIGRIIDSRGYFVGLFIAAMLSLTCFIGSFLLPETGKINRN
ncbi:MFS transporter [Peptoniphilus stercorisuis]|uniref:MFS family permease n=1 Tax=Peptoniphilus stercorisuis TaxID=1436965 RepID=A0ABS4KFK5_9FIRM|nr:MFS transporter [Peptoniphilus stercorisuis]MBP2026160.1 MFS family permease [Peptoniphilus stercorisuis]